MSRELDAEVAEKVMGDPRPAAPVECHSIDTKPIGTAWLHTHCYDRGDVCEIEPRPFSSNISAAMEVVGKMREDEWNCRIDISAPPGMKTTICEFWTGLGTVKAEAANESLPRTICCLKDLVSPASIGSQKTTSSRRRIAPATASMVCLRLSRSSAKVTSASSIPR